MNRLKLVIFDLDDTLFDSSGQLKPPDVGIESIRLFAGVPETLRDLRAQGFSLAIVSTGDGTLQEKKIQILGLRELVDAVHICDLPEEKQILFRRCFGDFGVLPSETLVVGDRIDREVQWGNALGCVTAQVLQGRHQHMTPVGELQEARFKIAGIPELLPILRGIG
jgi:FMN phosphatase YigB (HAD superfamily)